MIRRLQSPLFPLFQVHVDRGIPNTLRILCFFRDNTSFIHLYVKLNSCARCFLPALRRLSIKSALYEYKNKSIGNSAH